MYIRRPLTFFISAGLFTLIVGAVPAEAGQQGDPIDYDTARLERNVSMVRTSAPIALDGVLDEAAWATAPVVRGFIQNDPNEGAAASFDTDVRVLYDNEAIYFGVFAKDDDPAGIIVSDLKKDFNTGTSDGFRVVLDTFRDGRNGYQFAINPAGAKWDAQMANEGRENNANWDGIWEGKASIDAEGWSVEWAIPFQTLNFDPQLDAWGINFERTIKRKNETAYWAAWDRNYAFYHVSQAGHLTGLTDVKQAELHGLWLELRALGLATPNIGLLTNIISCPGGDFCALANAKSIPVAEAIQRRFDDLDYLHDIGELDLNISGCMNACGHHHVGHIGILGVDKNGEEWYQVEVGGNQSPAALGKVLGPSFARHEVTDVIERLIDAYLEKRNDESERFVDVVHRLGIEPFKTAVYGTPDQRAARRREPVLA